MNAFVYELIAEAVKAQPWYRKNANTIAAGLSALAAVLTFVVSGAFDLPVLVTGGILAAIPVINTFATKLLPNGFQLGMADKLAATPAAAKLPASPLLPSPDVVAAEVQRAQTAVHDRLAEINPAVSAELDRIRGALAPEYVGEHRLEQ